ncbi:hypothetical protein INR49_010296 [Caranx melampygus]|nr:hypothetical protein INR49_010296 [Caranx melampygus]
MCPHLVSRPLGTSADGLQEPVRISIPRYVLRGQGKDEHFEFEVKLAALEFPPKKLFGNRDERMRYLRNLFRVMLSSSSSPLRTDADGGSGLHLSKHTICEFSPFFKKGVFEYGSHGTG